jgi:hypothetical protein
VALRPEPGGNRLRGEPDVRQRRSGVVGEGHSLSQAVTPGKELFKTPIISPGTSIPVAGVAQLPRGEYRFTCRVHAFMSGKLVVR